MYRKELMTGTGTVQIGEVVIDEVEVIQGGDVVIGKMDVQQDRQVFIYCEKLWREAVFSTNLG